MKKFIYIIEGTAEGCDYTLGCNLTYKIVKGTTLEEVRDRIIAEQVEEDFFDVEEFGVDDIQIYEIGDSLEFYLADYANDAKRIQEEENQFNEEQEILRKAEVIKQKRKGSSPQL